MAKQRRPTRGSDPEQRSSEGPRTVEPASIASEVAAQDVAEHRVLANEGRSHDSTVAGALAATDGGSARLATALRMAPRDRAHTERLAAVVARSALPVERRAAIVARLQADQQLADEVSRQVNVAIGGDSESARASLTAVLEGAGAGLAARALVDQLPDWFGGVDGARRADAFCVALASTAPWWWDEEEVEPYPGDYAMEESGC